MPVLVFSIGILVRTLVNEMRAGILGGAPDVLLQRGSVKPRSSRERGREGLSTQHDGPGKKTLVEYVGITRAGESTHSITDPGVEKPREYAQASTRLVERCPLGKEAFLQDTKMQQLRETGWLYVHVQPEVSSPTNFTRRRTETTTPAARESDDDTLRAAAATTYCLYIRHRPEKKCLEHTHAHRSWEGRRRLV